VGCVLLFTPLLLQSGVHAGYRVGCLVLFGSCSVGIFVGFCFGGLCVVMCWKFEACCLVVGGRPRFRSLNGFCFFVRSSVLVLVFLECGTCAVLVLQVGHGQLAVR